MGAQPIVPRPAAAMQWQMPSAACNRSYLLAFIRAGLIAVVLLAVLVLIAWP